MSRAWTGSSESEQASMPGSSVHGTSQTRILEQVAILVPCTSLSALEGTSFVYSGSWEKLSNS